MKKNAKIAALILAAGCSSRMGRLKPLLPLGKSCVIEEAVKRFLKAGIEDVRVVLGCEAGKIAPLLDRLEVKWILNPDYRQGMLSSILAGIKSLEADIDAVFILPADIPLVKPQTIRALAGTYNDREPAVLYPRFLMERGHPPLISASLLSGLEPGLEGGLRSYLSCFEEKVADIDVVDRAVLMDCDTPEDYTLLKDYAAREDIPVKDECKALWNRYGLSPEVRAHSRLVADLARLFAIHLSRAGLELDIPLILAAGYLHDLMKGKLDHARAGADVLEELGYPGVAEIVSSHMNIQLKEESLDESALVYLSDKLVDKERIVSLDERFSKALSKFSDRPHILKSVSRRLEAAKTIKERIEAIVGKPIEKIIEKHAKALEMAPANGWRRIYLVRHGAVEFAASGKHYIGQLDLALSAQGVGQAESLREKLRYVSLSAVFCSDLARSVATAKIVAEPHGLPAEPKKALREISLGSWEGLSFNEVCTRDREAYEERGRDIVNFRPPGGESFFDCTCRVIPALFDILRSTRGDILIVGHAGINRILLCHAMGKALENLFEIKQDYGCLSVIGYRDFAFELLELKGTRHPPEVCRGGKSCCLYPA